MSGARWWLGLVVVVVGAGALAPRGPPRLFAAPSSSRDAAGGSGGSGTTNNNNDALSIEGARRRGAVGLGIASAAVAREAVAKDDDADAAVVDAPRRRRWGRAQLRKQFSSVLLREKLGAIPVFYVSNARGSPYLVTHNSKREQEALLFMEPAEAEELLYEFAQATGVKDARMYCMGLDRALELLKRVPAPADPKDPKAPFSMHYRLKPSREKIEVARKLVGARANTGMVPLFVAPQLATPKRGLSDARPAFFEIEDLNAAWAAALKKAGRSFEKPTVRTYNLVELILASELEPNADFEKLVFVPDQNAVKYVHSARRKGNGSARLHTAL